MSQPTTQRHLPAWQIVAEKALRATEEAIDANKASDAQKYAITSGIATEKCLLLEGQATQIVQVDHYRRDLPAMFQRLITNAAAVGVTIETLRFPPPVPPPFEAMQTSQAVACLPPASEDQLGAVAPGQGGEKRESMEMNPCLNLISQPKMNAHSSDSLPLPSAVGVSPTHRVGAGKRSDQITRRATRPVVQDTDSFDVLRDV